MLSLANQVGKILCVWAPKMIVVTLLIFPSPWLEIQITDFRSKLVQNIKYTTNEVTRTLLNDMIIFLLKGSFKAENIPCAVIISGTSFLAIYKLLSVQGMFSLNIRPSTFLKQKNKAWVKSYQTCCNSQAMILWRFKVSWRQGSSLFETPSWRARRHLAAVFTTALLPAFYLALTQRTQPSASNQM